MRQFAKHAVSAKNVTGVIASAPLAPAAPVAPAENIPVLVEASTCGICVTHTSGGFVSLESGLEQALEIPSAHCIWFPGHDVGMKRGCKNVLMTRCAAKSSRHT